MAVSSPGKGMRRLRIERGLDVSAVAAMTGLDTSRIDDIEEDVTAAWFEEALLLAQAYGLAIDDFAREVSASSGPTERLIAEEGTDDGRERP